MNQGRDEQRGKALSLKAQGESLAQIGKELGVSKSSVSRLLGEGKPPKEPSVDETFMDGESRFSKLLRDYGLTKEAGRICSYISSQGEGVYTNLQAIRRCLVEQGVAAGRIPAIVRHWAAQERQSIPSDLERDLITEMPIPKPVRQEQPDRWSLIGDTPARDPENGQYNWLQCLQLLEARKQPVPSQSSPGSDIVTIVLNQLKESNVQNQQLLQAMLDQRFSTLEQRISAASQDRRESSKIDVMASGLEGILGEARGIRADVKGVALMQLAKGEALPPPRSPQQNQAFAKGMEVAVRRQELTQRQAANLWAGGQPLTKDEEEELREIVLRAQQRPAARPPTPPPSPVRIFE